MKKQTTQLDPTTFEGSNEDMIWDLCRIQQWGVGYFGADKDGDAYVCPDPEHPKNKVKIIDIVKFAQQKSGLKLPALLSFLRFCSIGSNPLMLLLKKHVKILAMKTIIFWFTRLR